MIKWILDHKEDLGWAGAAIVGFWKSWVFIAKKIKPVVRLAKRVAVVSDRVDELENKVEIVEKRQFALIYVDTRPIFIMNKKNEVTHVNTAWLEMTEMQSEREALGFGYLQAIPEEDKEMMMDRSEIFLEHPSAFSGNVRFKKVKTGKIITVHCRSELINQNEMLYETVGILKET